MRGRIVVLLVADLGDNKRPRYWRQRIPRVQGTFPEIADGFRGASRQGFMALQQKFTHHAHRLECRKALRPVRRMARTLERVVEDYEDADQSG